MATFLEKLFRLPNRTAMIGTAYAQSNITFPFSRNPVDLSEIQFYRLTELATNKLNETLQFIAKSVSFDAEKMNEYSFNVTVEKSTRLKWFVQSFRFNDRKVSLVEVIGLVDEIGIRDGVMSLASCRILRHDRIVWTNGINWIPPFNNYSVAQYIYSYVHRDFSWKNHDENAIVARQRGSEYRTNFPFCS